MTRASSKATSTLATRLHRNACPASAKTAVTVEASHNRSQPVAEPPYENNTESKQIVYERSGTQFLRAVMPNHQRIGENQGTMTPNCPTTMGSPQEKQCFIVLLTTYQIIFHTKGFFW